MKKNQYMWVYPLTGALLCVTAASAQQDQQYLHWDPFASIPQQDQLISSNSVNRVTASLRFGLNITGKFKGIGAGFNPSPAAHPPTTPDGNPYNYGDGYVYPSALPSGSGLTWNWGYDSQSQVNTANNTVGLDRTSANSSEQSTDVDQNPGFEITYCRELGIKEDWHHMRYGVEGAFNYMPVSFNISGTYNEDITTYSYPFAPGTVPPGYNTPSLLPYQGSYAGPGFIIGSTPVVSPPTPISGASLFVQDSFNADMWGFRLGPYVEFPLGDKFNLHLSGGLSVGLLNSSASWSEKLILPSAAPQTLSGSGNDFSALFGGYISLEADYQINPSWDVEADVQFQDLGTYDHNFGERGAELDLSQSVYLEVGVSYSF
jgi:hypothetical protein